MEKLKKKEEELKREFRKKLLGYTTAAFGLVAGLAWNDAIKGLIEFLFPFQKGALTIKFVYAIVVTLVVVLVSIYLSKLLQKEGK